MVKAAQKHLLWDDVLPVTRAMSDDSRARFAALKSIQTRPVLASIVDAASRHGLWPELLQLLPLLPAAARRRVAALGTGFGRPVLAQIVGAAHEQRAVGAAAAVRDRARAAHAGRPRQAPRGERRRRPRRRCSTPSGSSAWSPSSRSSRRCCRPRRWPRSATGSSSRGGEEFVAALREAAERAGPRRLSEALRGGVSVRMPDRPPGMLSDVARPRRQQPATTPTAPSAARNGWTSTGRSTCAGCASRIAG